MRNNKTAILGITAALAAFAGTANAAVVIYGFDSNSISATTNGLSGSGVTANDAVPDTSTPNPSSIFEDHWRRTLSPEDARTVSFTLGIGATAIDLTGLSFTQGIDSASGTNDTFSVIDLAITTTGTETPGADDLQFTNFHGGTDTTTDPHWVSTGESITLTGLTNLTNTSVTFEFSVLYGTTAAGTGGSNNARYAFLDNVQITGAEAIPEPSTALLGALGFLALLRRRR